ncbi:AAA domain-containing protein [Flavobacterium sp. F372]|uniref:AAA family ATPase n=1 Tax=Flavobacterium bernardetii TaxID=2813823 RepID=A0ABR7IXA7_9FLAO|nr:AAA family ATPase [Flavobacterium bernardetii]MBC5834353.1 AAA family ATPase [Flavobacterium bernardetii]NHF70008.1 AAA domain-containing protein [Flavobacterium bernardetii]
MAFKPNEITKDHILKAIEKIEKEAIVLISPTRWNVEINNKKYPPKEVMRYAHEQMNGEKVWEYGGGEGTNKFLKKFDFPILDMTGNPLQEIVNRYKKYIHENGLKEEIYKWKLLGKFQGRPNINNQNFSEEIKDVKFENLIYPVGQGAIKHLAEARTELYRDCFKALFDENLPLLDRIKFFNEETLKIYRQIVPEERFSHHQDERTMSTFLTYHNPNLYTFYKNTFYQKFCDILGIKPKKKNEKYVHYMGLVNEFIDDYIKDDEELIDLVRSQIPSDAFQDTNFKILAQDILYQSLDKQLGANRNYWRIGTKDDTQSYWDYMKTNNLICIGWSDIGDLNEAEVKSKDDIKKLLENEGIYKDKKGVLTRKAGEIFDFYTKVNIGDIILAQDGETVLGIGIVKDEYFFNEKENFAHQKLIEWKVLNPKLKNKEGLQTTVYKLSEITTHHKIDAILNNSDFTKNTINANMKPSLNQILFGPPGSGKTYSTINKALEIVGVDINGKTRTEIKTLFDEKVKENRIVFSTFHQSMSYEDFVEGIKPITSGNDVLYEVQDGIFKNICNSATSNVSVENFDKVYQMLLEKIENETEELLELKTIKEKSFWVGINSNNNLSLYTTAKKNYQGVLTKEKIEAYANGFKTFTGWDGYASGIDNYLKEKLNLKIAPRKDNNNNFVLIIDEINRGNVSAIFGELITLIEEDKRLGKPEALKVTLPYSKKEFGVPSNLFIIGTMNTADRSVEALDTALRRRFSFEEMPPNYELDELRNSIFDFPASSILKSINHRIEKLLDKDHAIGHSYFISKDEVSIVESFYKCIIPLLQEYFFGDYGKIGLVLGKGFVRQKEWDKTSDSFADFDYDNSNDFEERNVFEIIDYRNENHNYSIGTISMTFEKAIKILMKNKVE